MVICLIPNVLEVNTIDEFNNIENRLDCVSTWEQDWFYFEDESTKIGSTS